MRILAIDIGNRCGVAHGETDDKPAIEAWKLRNNGDDAAEGARNFALALFDLVRWGPKPDLIAVENYLSPAVQRSADVVEAALLAHGALEAVAAVEGVKLARVPVNAIRRHFIGTATVSRGGQRSPRQRYEDRKALNTLVVERCIRLGYLTRDAAPDWDKAAAAALWDYCAVSFAKRPPAELVLFGE